MSQKIQAFGKPPSFATIINNYPSGTGHLGGIMHGIVVLGMFLFSFQQGRDNDQTRFEPFGLSLKLNGSCFFACLHYGRQLATEQMHNR